MNPVFQNAGQISLDWRAYHDKSWWDALTRKEKAANVRWMSCISARFVLRIQFQILHLYLPWGFEPHFPEFVQISLDWSDYQYRSCWDPLTSKENAANVCWVSCISTRFVLKIYFQVLPGGFIRIWTWDSRTLGRSAMTNHGEMHWPETKTLQTCTEKDLF